MTPKQLEVLRYVEDFTQRNGYDGSALWQVSAMITTLVMAFAPCSPVLA